MKLKSGPFARRATLTGTALIVSLLCAWPSVATDGEKSLRATAFELYDQGRYDEARPLLEKMEASGPVDGVLLYRLYYCQRAAEDPAARDTLDRARRLLEQEWETASGLETPFYLSNAYRNAGQLTDARRVAARTTERVEKGELAKPADGFEMFRLGKLYADQDREAEAVEWYARSLPLLAAGDAGGAAEPYVEWAGRYLVERAWEREDYEAAARYLELIVTGNASPADLDRLATALSRLERYGEAKSAWQRVEKLKPGDANRARYCWHLAEQADQLGELSPAAPDGRGWGELSKAELEQTMLDQARIVGEAVREVEEADKRLKKKRHRKLQSGIDEARPIFLGAALEYAFRGYGIRETAFFGGYAPLIFHSDKWKLPPR
jgi:tetratricopeptide (TPR) repeat protein